MRNDILIVGKSNTGKTSSIVPNKSRQIGGLNPSETVYVTYANKGIPIRGAEKLYRKGYNYFEIDNSDKLVALILDVDNNKQIKNLVIDDATFSITRKLFADTRIDLLREKESKEGEKKVDHYKKFMNVGLDYHHWFEKAKKCREDLNLIVMWHLDKDDDLEIGGKMIADKLNPLALFTDIVHAVYNEFDDDLKHHFLTKSKYARLTFNTVPTKKVPNDMQYIIEAITMCKKGEKMPIHPLCKDMEINSEVCDGDIETYIYTPKYYFENDFKGRGVSMKKDIDFYIASFKNAINGLENPTREEITNIMKKEFENCEDRFKEKFKEFCINYLKEHFPKKD